jgi:hypothetical protein
MFKRILHIDYDALTQYLICQAGEQDDLSFLEFERVQAHITTEFARMMEFDNENVESSFDADFVEILMQDLQSLEEVTEYTITRGPGIVTRYGDHLLKLPLILIEVDWRIPCQTLAPRKGM